jgi:hypothetical protein
MLKAPDHRFVALRGGASAEGDVEKEFCTLLKSGTCKDACVRRAYAIYQREYGREVVESLLLAQCTPEEIESLMRVPADVIHVYAHLFFDATVFEDSLDTIDYAHTYDLSTFGKELKEMACDLGKDCLKIKLSHGNHRIPAAKVKDEIMALAYVLAKHAKVNPLRSDVSKIALYWAKLAAKMAGADTAQDDQGIDKVFIELDAEEDTTDEKKSGIPQEEILH